MISPTNPGMKRVTMTLHPVDVDLLDRLGKLEGRNRSEEMRSILEEVRPMLFATVEAFEAAMRQRHALDEKATEAAVAGLVELMPEVEHLAAAYVAALSRIGDATASQEASDTPSSGEL